MKYVQEKPKIQKQQVDEPKINASEGNSSVHYCEKRNEKFTNKKKKKIIN